MEKKIVLTLLVLYSLVIYFQVGINTYGPKITLDVAESPAQPTILNGIITPRITGAQPKTKRYTSVERGAVVFVIDADTMPNDTFINISFNTRVGLGTSSKGSAVCAAVSEFVFQDNVL